MMVVVMMAGALLATAGIGVVRTISAVSTAHDHCWQLAAGASRAGAVALALEQRYGQALALSDAKAEAAAHAWLAANSISGTTAVFGPVVAVEVSEVAATPVGSWTVHASVSANAAGIKP